MVNTHTTGRHWNRGTVNNARAGARAVVTCVRNAAARNPDTQIPDLNRRFFYFFREKIVHTNHASMAEAAAAAAARRGAEDEPSAKKPRPDDEDADDEADEDEADDDEEEDKRPRMDADMFDPEDRRPLWHVLERMARPQLRQRSNDVPAGIHELARDIPTMEEMDFDDLIVAVLHTMHEISPDTYAEALAWLGTVTAAQLNATEDPVVTLISYMASFMTTEHMQQLVDDVVEQYMLSHQLLSAAFDGRLGFQVHEYTPPTATGGLDQFKRVIFNEGDDRLPLSCAIWKAVIGAHPDRQFWRTRAAKHIGAGAVADDELSEDDDVWGDASWISDKCASLVVILRDKDKFRLPDEFDAD